MASIQIWEPTKPTLKDPIDVYARGLVGRVRYWVGGVLARWEAYKDARRDAIDERRRAQATKRSERAAAKIESRLKADLRKEQRRIGRAIIDRATRLEFAHWYTRGRNAGKISRIKFAQVASTPAAHYFRLDTVRMPRGRGITSENMSDPDILNELGLACGAPVRTYRHYEKGFWFIVDRESGIAAIPHYVEYVDALARMPKSAGVLDIPLGIGHNNKFYHADITKMPHLLIGGATGFGKSVFLHGMIATLLQRAKPWQVKLCLIDLKGGIELGCYADAPHLLELGESIAPQVYGKREDVIPVLRAVAHEMERRLQKFQATRGVRNISDWNFKHGHGSNAGQHMPYIVVIIDEVHNVMLDRKRKAEAENLMADIAARARAVGIHMVITTQHPSVDVITGLIKANYPARIAFNTASMSASRVILDKSDAAGLGVPGRMIYQEPMRRSLVQAGYLSSGLVDDILDRVREGKPSIAEATANIGKLDMVKWAIQENGGKFTINSLYQAFRAEGITHRDARDVVNEYKDQTVTVEDRFYRIFPRDGKDTWVEVNAKGEAVEALTLEEAAEWSIRHNKGKFDRRSLFREFKTLTTQAAINALIADNIGETVEVERVAYRLTLGGPRKATQWVKV